MRLPILLTAALLMVAACSPQTESKAPDAAAPAAEAAPDPVMPADAPPQEEATASPASATDESCILDQGSDGAMDLVRRCMAVSTASHPPCNPENPCKLIQGEIDRACAAYKPGETKPAECTA